MRATVWGGGAALAQPLIRRWLERGWEVTAVCRHKQPEVKHERLSVSTTWTEWVGQTDLLVTVTGAVEDARLTEMTDGQWDRSIQDNLTSVFRALRVCLPVMRPGSNVVVVGSVVGSTGGKGCANYAAAKAGLVGLVRGAANEWADKGILINLLELGFMGVGMGDRLDDRIRQRVMATIPLKRFGTADDFLTAVDFLSTTRYMTGGVLTVAGGLR